MPGVVACSFNCSRGKCRERWIPGSLRHINLAKLVSRSSISHERLYVRKMFMMFLKNGTCSCPHTNTRSRAHKQIAIIMMAKINDYVVHMVKAPSVVTSSVSPQPSAHRKRRVYLSRRAWNLLTEFSHWTLIPFLPLHAAPGLSSLPHRPHHLYPRKCFLNEL